MSISIKEIMKKDFSKISSSDSVESAVELIEKRGVDYLLVEEEGEIKGVVTSHELVGYPSSRLVLDCRIKPIATIAEETWLNEALKVLEEKEVNFLVILNREGSPIGVINKEIIISFLYQEVKKSNKEKEEQITERKRAGGEKRKAQAEAAAVLDGMIDVIGISDIDGKITRINKEVEAWGYKKEELIGKPVAEFIAKRSLPKLMEERERTLEEGVIRDLELIGLKRDGSEFPVLVNVTLLKDTEGKPTGRIFAVRDITEHKQAEEKVKEAYRLREHFLKETSHRIITPVAIIGGHTDLLLARGNLDEDQKEKIRIIRKRNEEVHKLTRDALLGKYLEGEEEEEEEGGEG